MLSDIYVLKKIKDGDIKAFEALFRLYYSPLCMYAVSIIGRMDAAEEIVQELFYVLWRDKGEIQVLRSLKSYLYGAVKNRTLQYLEHLDVRSRHRESVMAAPQQEQDSPQDQLEYKELQSVIDKTIGMFPERRRQIFYMHRQEGMKYAEIAQALSLSVKTVEAEMTKALLLLRKEIENYTRIA